MGGRGSSSKLVDTSYQGKQFARASSTGKSVDVMHAELKGIAVKVLANNPEAIRQINSAVGNPNASITIYRATIGDSINNGDYVFLDKSLAEKWSKTAMGRPKPGVKVLKKKVKASKVNWTGKNLEFVYSGR